jgi:hypothetical protein
MQSQSQIFNVRINTRNINFVICCQTNGKRLSVACIDDTRSDLLTQLRDKTIIIIIIIIIIVIIINSKPRMLNNFKGFEFVLKTA